MEQLLSRTFRTDQGTAGQCPYSGGFLTHTLTLTFLIFQPFWTRLSRLQWAEV